MKITTTILRFSSGKLGKESQEDFSSSPAASQHLQSPLSTHRKKINADLMEHHKERDRVNI